MSNATAIETRLSPDELIDTLKWRYATKQFDAQCKIPDDLWDALEQSLVLTPSSFGLQPWRFVVVTDPQVKARLKDASWGQGQLVDASHIVVFTVREDLDEEYVDRVIANMAAARGVSPDTLKGYRDVVLGFISNGGHGIPHAEWNARQAYIALGQFMTSAALLGVDTCPLEGIEPQKYDEVLGLAGSGYRTVCACAAGYRSEADKYATAPKARFDRSEVVVRI